MFELHPQLKEDSRLIASLGSSDWLLMNDARFVWLAQVPRYADAQLLVHLPAELRQEVRAESDLVVEILRSLFNPDQINVAQIGNVVSQLHIHHVARFKDDALWPKPIWGQTPAQPYREAEYRDRLTLLRAHF
ncbi:MAG: HIT domain-containing protein [Litorivicinus sp.]